LFDTDRSQDWQRSSRNTPDMQQPIRWQWLIVWKTQTKRWKERCVAIQKYFASVSSFNLHGCRHWIFCSAWQILWMWNSSLTNWSQIYEMPLTCSCALSWFRESPSAPNGDLVLITCFLDSYVKYAGMPQAMLGTFKQWQRFLNWEGILYVLKLLRI
jgi:hypothetical protein